MRPTQTPSRDAASAHPHAGPGRCEELRAALDEVVALEDLADRHLAHAEACPDCEDLLERQRGLAVLVTRARRAHDRAPDLSLQAWARVRVGVDRAQARRRRYLVLGFGLVAAAVAALVVIARPGVEQAQPIAARALAPTPRAEVLASAAPAFEPRRDTREGDREVVVAAGDRLLGGERGRTLEAFGRHSIILERGAAVRARQWAPGGMALELEAGSATFEVERATRAETFIVYAGDVTVHVKGTVFSVDRDARGDVRVTVDRGRVQVEHDGERIDVTAGERVVIPAPVDTAQAAPSEPPSARPPSSPEVAPAPKPRKRPAPEKVVEIDAGRQRAPHVSEPGVSALEASRLVEPILATVRAGRCAQALNALAEIRRALAASQEDGPRAFLWMTAWCKRKLGDVEGSATLFRRYGSAGPWPVPVGAELPPLP